MNIGKHIYNIYKYTNQHMKQKIFLFGFFYIKTIKTHLDKISTNKCNKTGKYIGSILLLTQ